VKRVNRFRVNDGIETEVGAALKLVVVALVVVVVEDAQTI
jgi:hypothetical protein